MSLDLLGHHKAPQCFHAAAPDEKQRREKSKCISREKHTALAKPLSNTDYSDYVLLRLWGMNGAYLEDFDLLAKKDLRLGQVLLIDALDGHLPVCLLHSRRTRTRGWKEISKTLTTSVWRLANLNVICHLFWQIKDDTFPPRYSPTATCRTV